MINKIVKGFQNNAGVRIPSTLPKPTSQGTGGGGSGRVPLPGMGYKSKAEFRRARKGEVENKMETLRQDLAKAKENNNSFRITKIKGQLRKLNKYHKNIDKMY